MARNTSSPIQQFRGTTVQHAIYTGLPGELTVDTDKHVVVVHDGVTAGGHPMASADAVKVAYDKAVEAKNTADAALPKAGGTLPGAVVENLLPLSGTSVSLDLTAANNFTHNVTADTTFTVTANTGNSFQLGTLVLTNGGAHTVTWPSSFKWAGGTPPLLMASGIDVITFFTIDGGATYYAAQAMTGIA